MRSLDSADEFIQLQVHRLAVPVLRVLDEEHHQKGYDGGRCVYEELPRVAETEDRPRHPSGQDDQQGYRKGLGMTYPSCRPFRKPVEQM